MFLTRRLRFLLVSGLLFSATACLPSREVNPTPTPLPPPVSYEKTIYTVERGPISSQFSVTGKILPARQEELIFRTSGHVDRVTVQEGDMVKAGQVLAELQVDDLLKQLEQAYLDLEVAQAQLAEEERPRRFAMARAEHQVKMRELQVELARAALEEGEPEPSAQAELSLTLAEEQLARLQARKPDYDADVLIAKINLDRADETLTDAGIEYQEALDRPWEGEEVRERYAAGLQQAQWNRDIAWARYQQALTAREVYQHDLKVQEMLVELEKANAVQAQESNTTTLELQLKLADESLELAKLDLEELSEEVSSSHEQAVQRAQLAVERLQAQLADRQIVAPFDGIVLQASARPIRPGDQIAAFEPVLVIGDPSELVIGVRRSQDRVNEIREDTEVQMSLATDATERYDTRLLSGFVPFDTVGDVSSFNDRMVYFAMMSLPDRDEIPVGKTVYLDVVLGRNEDALLVPPATIRSFRGRDFVIVQEGDRQRRVDVQIGIETDEHAEISGALQEGDQVVGP